MVKRGTHKPFNGDPPHNISHYLRKDYIKLIPLPEIELAQVLIFFNRWNFMELQHLYTSTETEA